MAFWQMFYSVGSFIAYWINYACQKHVKTLGEWGKIINDFPLRFSIFRYTQLSRLIHFFTTEHEQCHLFFSD